MTTALETQKFSYFEDEDSAAAFNKAFQKLLAEKQKELMNKYIPRQNMQRLKHGGEWSHPGLPQATQGELHQHSSTNTIKFEDLINHNTDAIDQCIIKVTLDMEQQFAQMMYSTISAACEQTGNTVDAKGSGSLPEAFVEMIEKVDFSVDNEGNVQLPSLHMGPETLKLFTEAIEAAPPEFHQRVEEIQKRKTREALDREAERKARFARYGDNT